MTDPGMVSRIQSKRLTYSTLSNGHIINLQRLNMTDNRSLNTH